AALLLEIRSPLLCLAGGQNRFDCALQLAEFRVDTRLYLGTNGGQLLPVILEHRLELPDLVVAESILVLHSLDHMLGAAAGAPGAVVAVPVQEDCRADAADGDAAQQDYETGREVAGPRGPVWGRWRRGEAGFVWLHREYPP